MLFTYYRFSIQTPKATLRDFILLLQFTWLRFKASISFPKTRNGFPEMECENLTKVLPEVDFLFHEGNPEGLEEMILKT